MLNKIKLEIEKESCRFDCPDYYGVIFVHPDDVDDVVELMKPYTKDVNIQRKRITLKSDGVFKVSTVQGDHPHHDYAGLEITSTLISLDCFGKYELPDHKYVKVGTVGCEQFIMYMTSRGRSRSKYHSHMILF